MSYKSIYNILGINEELFRLERQAKLGWRKEFRTLMWFGLKDGMKIVDIGGGAGFFSELLLKHLPNCSITIVDIDEEMIEVGKERLEKYKGRVKFVQASAVNTTLDSEEYDFAICRFLYQHIDNHIKVTREIHRILKHGGIISIIDNDKDMSGICEPEIINNNRTMLEKLEKKVKWNRDIGRYLLKFLQIAQFKELDFEAVTIHSDIVGIKNILGNSKKNEEMVSNIAKSNAKLAKIIEERENILNSDEVIMIMINFIAKGKKL